MIRPRTWYNTLTCFFFNYTSLGRLIYSWLHMNHMAIVMKHEIKKLENSHQQNPLRLAFVFSSMDAKIRGNMRQQMWYQFTSNEIITLFTKKLEYPLSTAKKVADLYLRTDDRESLSDFFTNKIKCI